MAGYKHQDGTREKGSNRDSRVRSERVIGTGMIGKGINQEQQGTVEGNGKGHLRKQQKQPQGTGLPVAVEWGTMG